MYENYATLRDALGVSDYYVCKSCGISKSSMSKWKTGSQTLGMKNLQRLAQFFEVPIEQILGTEALPEQTILSVRAISDRLADVSDEAVQIAVAYDRASPAARDIVRRVFALDATA